MALCGHENGCQCLITAGEGIAITGSGVPGDPWSVSVAPIEWTAFDPTWGNVTIGDGETSGYYATVPGGIFFYAILNIGSTTSASGSGVYFDATSIPDISTAPLFPCVASGRLYIPTNDYPAVASSQAASTRLYAFAKDNNITGSVPDTWADGAFFQISGLYPLNL